MRRSSIITIILLVLIIICLSVALVVTNLPKKEQPINNTSEDVTPVDEKVETPSYLDLNSEIVADMYKRLNSGFDVIELFHYLKLGKITIEDLTDEDIQTVAFYYDCWSKVEKSNSTLSFEDGILKVDFMDETVNKLFGNIKYEHSYAYWGKKSAKRLVYSEEDGVYHSISGFGGGSNFNYYTAITEVREYSDRYEVVEKGVGILKNAFPSDECTIYPYYTTITYSDEPILTYKTEGELNGTKSVYSGTELGKKAISTCYDQATEYKHTFMKNEDGSYYWIKSEIVK